MAVAANVNANNAAEHVQTRGEIQGLHEDLARNRESARKEGESATDWYDRSQAISKEQAKVNREARAARDLEVAEKKTLSPGSPGGRWNNCEPQGLSLNRRESYGPQPFAYKAPPAARGIF